MTTIDNSPGGSGGNDQGPGATLVGSRLSDVAGSVHDPLRDLKLPVLHLHEWAELGNDQRWIAAVIAGQGLAEAEYVIPRNDGKLAAKQKAPRKDALKSLSDLFAGVAPEKFLSHAKAVAPKVETLSASKRQAKGAPAPHGALPAPLVASARVFMGLRERFSRLEETQVDLRAPWFDVRDQKDAAGCVGWALGDLLWRQSQSRLDLPSARFIWQGAKELDGETRPTTMIAGAGTSLRAALRLVKTLGYALESELSSENDASYHGSIDAFYKALRPRRIHNFINLGNDIKTRVAWLASGRPLVVSLRAGQNFISTTGNDAVIPGDDIRSKDLFGHCATVLGYRIGRVDGTGKFSRDARLVKDVIDDIEPGDHKQEAPIRLPENLSIQYLIRNTAGAGWGDRGYAWMNHDDFRRQVRETYGVFQQRSDFTDLAGRYDGEEKAAAR